MLKHPHYGSHDMCKDYFDERFLSAIDSYGPKQSFSNDDMSNLIPRVMRSVPCKSRLLFKLSWVYVFLARRSSFVSLHVNLRSRYPLLLE